MFFTTQSPEQQKEYEDFLKIAGSLSNLFSESATPYLYYRVAEKVFCRAFGAEDLSRGDVSADAKKGTLGIGLKTFLNGNSNSFQKVAEFNKDKNLYADLSNEKKIRKIAELRNQRINFTKRTYELDTAIYHCVVRDENKFMIYEESMELVNLEGIRNIKKKKSSITFDDGISEYSFLESKSTLTKRFKTNPIIHNIEIQTIEDPLLQLKEILESINESESQNTVVQTLYLPLYGIQNGHKFVYEKSGLNAWNSDQKKRKRNPNEIEIRVSSFIHLQFPGFFPSRNMPFNLKLPNGELVQSSICQANGKALMSYSNKRLGQWILREVLNLNEGEILTYQKLQIIGIDSIRIDKMKNGTFEINFSKLGSYEDFLMGNNQEFA